MTQKKKVATELDLKRMASEVRLFNYCEYAEKMSALRYATKVINSGSRDPVLLFELDNKLNSIEIFTNYFDDVNSLNYTSFIEWQNPA